MRSVEEHLGTILDTVDPLPPYEQPLLEAIGLPICEDVAATIDLPTFDNSAMDGYACRLADLEGVSKESPVRLPVVGESAAGQTKAYGLSPGQAVKIMTGAPMPTGADVVVPIEWTDGGRANVTISQLPAPGQHVRPRGEDVRAGDALLEEGDVLGPRQVAILAAVGRARVMARPRPRVVVLSTGSELREPGTPLGFDSIYDSNSYTLAAAVRQADAIAYRIGSVADDPQELTDTLSDQLVRADLVVTSGGVSKGDYDVVKDVLSRVGTVQFTEVGMQPGKPQGFGTIGEDETPIFTLPGNPVSSYISFEVFVMPAIRRMMGKLPYRRPLVRARCATGFTSPKGRKQFVRGHFEVTARGAVVTP
ncbi:MAG: molybdopterin molybdotransferase MoeA, partial [Nocardioidaceae bacterium]|nr:molybdopterin molybdotransferase MoeA [Nocardioidaceae bacterium]